MPTWIAYVPAGLGAVGAVAALLFDAWGARRAAVVSAALLLTAGAAVSGWLAVTATKLAIGAAVAGLLTSLVPTVALLLGAVILLGGVRVLAAAPSGGLAAALIAFAAAASALVAASFDLLVLFVAVEALALTGYALVALGGDDRAREAALKWFVQGSVATALFVVGLGVLYGASGGSVAYPSLTAASSEAVMSGTPIAFTVGLVLTLAALAFKAGAFPLHSWAPDAYETATPLGAAVLASSGKGAAIAAILWLAVNSSGAPEAPLRSGVFWALAVGSIVFGNLAALRQRSFARMLAYSGIAQVGYALTGIPYGTTAEQLPPMALFAAVYAIAAAAAFLFIEAVREGDPDWDGTIAGLAGLWRARPALSVALAVIMFSLTGIPLFAGFWGKLLVFTVAAMGPAPWLAVIGVLGSVVSFGYYGGVLRSAFLDDAADPDGERVAAGPATRATVALAAVVLIIGVTPLVTGLTPIMRTLLGQ